MKPSQHPARKYIMLFSLVMVVCTHIDTTTHKAKRLAALHAASRDAPELPRRRHTYVRRRGPRLWALFATLLGLS